MLAMLMENYSDCGGAKSRIFIRNMAITIINYTIIF